MKVFKNLLTATIVLTSIISTQLKADVRLVGVDVEPSGPTITEIVHISVNTQIAGEFSLLKDSLVNTIQTSINGTGSVLISIYTQNIITGMPESIIYNNVWQISSSVLGSYTSDNNLSIILAKGSYWFVIEPINITEKMFYVVDPLILPLTRYAINDNCSIEWMLSKHKFPLIMEGHPTGQNTK